jgi:RNA polymerase sigma-70 factor (ECF subfamily)
VVKPLAQANDWTLMNRSGSDPAALQELFERHRDYVFRLAWSMVRNKTTAEDLTQDVFCRLAASRKRYLQRAAFRTWLYRVTANSVHDYHRKNRHQPGLTETPPSMAVDNPEAVSDLYRVMDMLNDLPERQRQVVILRVFEGFSVTETASAMGCRGGSVKTHLHRALQKLRSNLLDNNPLIATTTGD